MNSAPHHVKREEIIDYQTYSEIRDEIRDEIMKIKTSRRIHLGQYLTFLFENHETIKYQIQEITRAERTVRESSIQEEIAVYNSLLGSKGQLGCALLIEIPEEKDRRPLLTAWLGLQEHFYLVLADGSRVYAEYDSSQVGEDRLSAVQYLTFSLDSPPVGLGCDFENLNEEIDLSKEQMEALAEDLSATQVV
tara:strand:+ start:1284 stop:1859 length:576 start_codon:yes stop_codon:yes gene_type:complete